MHATPPDAAGLDPATRFIDLAGSVEPTGVAG